ncbi:hypothetical protein MNEG_8295 [Monoraphidium neglectum]|uniref:Uncharacterized protein n=1 Tax=Monoraphidium neglectum TaxID=145388 RepID=A0A0D2KWP5_9CHLO|nr:hypothetical protein MNEG_8295 [Monoraphidium neglectum]KIY99663.1 hypothetical protein MNEG_8295 [Monoraphidium neglectum]|eukprot:XP_013898683.1 hypothetical protein MNEG_8295 [Monoraphidium neglectum]
MLPKNNLQRDRLRKLRVFCGPDHPFGALHMVPWRMPPKQLEDHKRGWLMPAGFEPMNPQAYARRMLGSRRPAGVGAAAGARQLESQQEQQQQQQQEQQQQQQQPAGAEQGQQGEQQHQAPVIPFDDLLASDERQFIEECRRRGLRGTRS